MQSDLTCKGCRERYSSSRMPRLVPICGHSFCQRCLLGSLASQEQGKFAFRCPQDETVMEVSEFGLSLFPINIDLLRLAGQSPLFSLQVSKISDCPEDDSQLLSALQGLSDKSRNKSYSEEGSELCPIHREKIKNVCIQHHKKICSDCALFGEHKGHNVMKIQDVVDQASLKAEKALMISNEITDAQTKKYGLKLLLQLGKASSCKREKMVSSVRGRFNKAVQALRKEEKKCIDKIDGLLTLVDDIAREKAKCPEDLASRALSWQNGVLQMANSITQCFQDVQQLVKYVVEGKESDLLKEGAIILTSIQNHYQKVLSTHQKQLSELTAEFNPQFQSYIPEFCTINKAETKLPKAKRNVRFFRTQSSVFGAGIGVQPVNHLQSSGVMATAQPRNLLNSTQPIFIQQKPFLQEQLLLDQFQVQAKTAQPVLPPPPLQQQIKQVKARSPKKQKQNDISIIKAGKKKGNIRLPQRFQPVLQQIRSGKSDLIDLTSSQVGDSTVLQLMELVKGNQRAKTLKLVRCKLTDESVAGIYQALLSTSIVSLNLSQNLLSEKAVDQLLESGLEGRTVTLSQNKINARNIRAKLERLKKAGIGVTL